MKRISIHIHTLFQQSHITPPELFNEVFWEIILTWMQVEVNRRATWASATNPSQRDERLILKTLRNKQNQDRNPSVKTGVQLVSHSSCPPWSASPQTPGQGNVFQVELFKAENTEKCLLKIKLGTDVHKYPILDVLKRNSCQNAA